MPLVQGSSAASNRQIPSSDRAVLVTMLQKFTVEDQGVARPSHCVIGTIKNMLPDDVRRRVCGRGDSNTLLAAEVTRITGVPFHAEAGIPRQDGASSRVRSVFVGLKAPEDLNDTKDQAKDQAVLSCALKDLGVDAFFTTPVHAYLHWVVRAQTTLKKWIRRFRWLHRRGLWLIAAAAARCARAAAKRALMAWRSSLAAARTIATSSSAVAARTQRAAAKRILTAWSAAATAAHTALATAAASGACATEDGWQLAAVKRRKQRVSNAHSSRFDQPTDQPIARTPMTRGPGSAAGNRFELLRTRPSYASGKSSSSASNRGSRTPATAASDTTGSSAASSSQHLAHVTEIATKNNDLLVPLAGQLQMVMGEAIPADAKGPYKIILATAEILGVPTTDSILKKDRVLIDIALDISNLLYRRLSTSLPDEHLPEPPSTPAEAVSFLSRFRDDIVVSHRRTV
jgi:hypothetical protein